jgi:cytochrome c oxidase subunit II
MGDTGFLARGLVVVGSCGLLAAVLADSPRQISITAERFSFSTPEIRVRKGERVTLVLASADMLHGFAVPDLGVRVDLVPGKTVALTITPDRAGRFVFLCDNFCGEGHDRMAGTLVVTDD